MQTTETIYAVRDESDKQILRTYADRAEADAYAERCLDGRVIRVRQGDEWRAGPGAIVLASGEVHPAPRDARGLPESLGVPASASDEEALEAVAREIRRIEEACRSSASVPELTRRTLQELRDAHGRLEIAIEERVDREVADEVGVSL